MHSLERVNRGSRSGKCYTEQGAFQGVWVEKTPPAAGAQSLKSLTAIQETWVQSLGWGDPLDKEMATHSSILSWRIPWTEEPGRLQSMGSQESDTTEYSTHAADARHEGDHSSIPGWGRSPREGNGNPLQYSCLGNPTDRGVWRATVPGATRVGCEWVTKHSHIHSWYHGQMHAK